MAASSSLIKALVLYGKTSSANLTNLQTWSDAAIASIAAGNGGQVVSGSGNGMAFTQNTSLTHDQWFEALQFAINRCNATTASGVSKARFR